LKILDTVVFISSSNPNHRLYAKAIQYLRSIKTQQDVYVPSVVLLEFDLELKSHKVSKKQREKIFTNLSLVIPSQRILPNNPSIHSKATLFDKKNFYFDSLIAATALEYKATTVSTDNVFDAWNIPRIW